MKRRIIIVLLAISLSFVLFPSTAFAANYHTGDIAVINSIIDNNGLDLPKAPEPIDGSTYPPEWDDIILEWDNSAPKRVIKLYLWEKNLTGDLDVSGLSELQYLGCGDNGLDGLNVSDLTNLEQLWCGNNQLTELNVSTLTNLKYLHCNKNQLTELNVSHLTKLIDFDCGDNLLTVLDVSDLEDLKWFYCHKNKLTSLTLGENLTELLILYCFENQLTELDVSHFTALIDLWCSNNELTTLDVSHLTALKKLICNNNQLTELELNGTAVFNSIDVSYNYMADTSKVTGQDIDWDSSYYFTFNPQYRRITYNANGGTGSMDKGRAVDGEAFTLPVCNFTAPAETQQFKEWAIGSEDGTKINAGDQYTFTADTTVYAIWANVYPITVINGTASAGKAAQGTIVTIEANDAPTGKEFKEWKVNSGNVTLANASASTTTFTMPAEPVSLEAVFKDKSTPSEADPADTLPKTGENGGYYPWLALMLLSAGGLLFVHRKKRISQLRD